MAQVLGNSAFVLGSARFVAQAYVRERHLPRLIALWPAEIADRTPEGRANIVRRLRRALRSERGRGRAGHWSYDLNRHIALLGALKAELCLCNRGP